MSFSKNIKITSFQLSDTNPVYSQTSWTGTTETRSTNIQYYQIQFTLQFNQADSAEYKAFVAQYSQGAPFTMGLGFFGNYTGSETKSIAAEYGASVGTYQVQAHTTLEIGSLIQFENHTKIYKIMANDTDNGILSVWPLLRANVQAGEQIKYQNIQGSWILDTSNEYQITVQNQMSVQLTATEAI